MKEFFEWLANPGPMEEIFLSVILILLGLLIFFIIKNVSINYKGIKINPDKSSEEHNKQNTDNTKNQNQVLCGSNASIIASQDYRIISLIVQAHANRIREELKRYCTVNGLDKKNKDEYMIYVDEKKNLYIAELKEMFNHEYMSYDLINITEIYEIIDDVKDQLMNKLEKLYIKIRDISIEEHTKINEDRFKAYDECMERFLAWQKADYATLDERKLMLSNLINEYKEKCEKIIINERIDILNKQLQKIDMAKKDLTDIVLHKVIEKMQLKLGE